MTVSLVMFVKVSRPGRAVESKTTPRTPEGLVGWAGEWEEEGGRGMRYPKPLGWMVKGERGKTRETTPTVVRGLSGRASEGIRGVKAGVGMDETRWEVVNEPDGVETWY